MTSISGSAVSHYWDILAPYKIFLTPPQVYGHNSNCVPQLQDVYLTVREHPSIFLPPLLSFSSLLYSHLLSHTHPCSYIHSPTLFTITSYQTLEVDDSRTPQTSISLWESTPTVVDIPLPPPLLPLELWTSFGRIGTSLCDTTAPSAVTWTPIYERLGTRRLGTAFLCISL
jgi:hypothetical protein